MLAIIGSRRLEIEVRRVSMLVRLSDLEIRPPRLAALRLPNAQPHSHGLCTIVRLQCNDHQLLRKGLSSVCIFVTSCHKIYITRARSGPLGLFFFHSASDHHLLSYSLIHFLLPFSLKSFTLFQSLIHFSFHANNTQSFIMRYASAIGVLAIAAATANAQTGTTIQVAVGQNGLTYTPNNITAAVGTAIEFSFFPKVCLSPSLPTPTKLTRL